MKKYIAAVFYTILLSSLYAQVSFVPSIDIFSLTHFKKEKPYFETAVDATLNLNIQASHRAYFDAAFSVNLDNPIAFFNLDKTKRKAIEAFYLDSALTFPSINDTNIYFALFYGQYDYLNSDKILRETAKVAMESSAFQHEYPTFVFAPRLSIDGLGVSLYGSLKYLPVYFAGYTYWNGLYTKDSFEISTDFRMGRSFSAGAVNLFLGAKFSRYIKDTILRAGISGILQANEIYEFYYDAGIDRLTLPDPDAYKKFYMLFEPRGKYDKFSFSVPFFMAPVSSLPAYMDDVQYADSMFTGLGLKLAGGNLEKYHFEAGASFCTSVNPQNISKFSAFTCSISPFCTTAFAGNTLDFRVNIHPFLYEEPEKMVSISIQFKAVK